MTKKIRLVMATNNAAKLREARAIAGDRLEILSLSDVGYHEDIQETADTLEGNALIKVRAIKDATGLDCFADDTGLLVDALDGAPGVHTARYAGEQCNPDDNIELLLHNLEGVADRRACFRTCVALSLDGEEHTFFGEVPGTIANERHGSKGFGYDPVFIPEETGMCFAEMTDEAKNAISHRGRAVSSMMKWIATLCLCLICAFTTDAATSDWRLFNSFDDKADYVFDTPSKTYFLVQPQLYESSSDDNGEKLLFLFVRDKDTEEVRAYNSLNFLSGSMITQANYNADKNYLLIVYDDYTIDFLYDNGELHTIFDLKNFSTSYNKNVRSISFDPELDRVYLTTDFGYMVINDRKHEVATSGIYGAPIDRMARLEDKLIIIRDGQLYWDDADSRHISLDDFKPLDWNNGSDAVNLVSLSPSKCLISKKAGNNENYYVVSWPAGTPNPSIVGSGNYPNATVAFNKQGALLMPGNIIIQIDRESGERTVINKRTEDRNTCTGSWDLKEFYFSKPREGFYSCRLEEDGDWTVTSMPARPNAPASFRSDNLMYTSQHGVLVNTHGTSPVFSEHLTKNPILLSGLRDGNWSMYGLPYLDSNANSQLRLINPTGMAQDPDDPDVFYFGSVANGMLRYNIKDGSSLLHMTRSTDNPSYPGHVAVSEPHASWKSVYMLLHPQFDTRGNLILTHTNTDNPNADDYVAELWIWPKENRLATVSPETYRPFIQIPLQGVVGTKYNKALPLSTSSTRDMVAYFIFRKYDEAFFVYDHNGTPDVLTDDRMATLKDLEDADGKLSFHYIFCATEDPQTGFVWVGTDNGVFTLNPAEAFSNPTKAASRIKVSRNDGTSLADYLLAGITVNNISIDGQGRKWFSLSGGGLVCTSADGRTIIQEINSDNSMLPSDMVYASCYNPDNNSMMISTSAGLCEYFMTGQTSDAVTSKVRAYPNPVSHDYYGWVTIDGLEDDCIVKITDSAGNLVRELGPAIAGKVQWDACGMDLNRVPSGVYFVLASSGPAGGSYSEATKILVINR